MPSNDERERTRLLQQRARSMRKDPTDAEESIWAMLRDRRLSGVKFRRQRIIEPYIVDFASLEHRIIIEADGGQHADDARDARRDAFLRQKGFRILRFWNNDVLNNPSGVFVAIHAALHTPHPSAAPPLPPSPVSGEGIRTEP